MANNPEEPMSRQNIARIPAPGQTISEAERAAIINSTAGSLTPEEGEELARIIEESCERVDERA